MSNRSERLFSALNQISDAHIDEAADLPAKRSFHWKQWSTVAACVTLAVMVSSIFPHLGGCGAGGSGGHEEGSTFMAYAGPILPLTLQEKDQDLTAERIVTLDFAPWVPQWWSNQQEADSRKHLTPHERQKVLADYNKWYPDGGQWRTSSDILVKDTYTLTNPTDQDKIVTVQLPFVSSLLTLGEDQPTLSLDDIPLKAELLLGSHSPDYEYSTWKEVSDQLSDGHERVAAQQPVPPYADIPVIVYGYEAQVLQAIRQVDGEVLHVTNTFDLDYSRTGVLTFNYNGGTNDSENHYMERDFSLPNSWNPSSHHFLLLLGEDVKNFTSQIPERDGEAVPYVRVESDLDTMLRYAMQEFLQKKFEEQSNGLPSGLTFEQCYALLRRFLPQEALLHFDSDIYRNGGFLPEFLDQLCWMDRVLWAQAEITIPAGGSRTLTASFCKKASFDHTCAQTENEGISGYDLMPWVDSNLRFTAQTAVLEDRKQIEIVRQNFGFDPVDGVNTVPLVPDNPHYYLEVRGVTQLPQKPPIP